MPGHPSVRPGAIAREARVSGHAVNRRRALDAVAGEHAASQRHPGALVGRLVEAQREASRLRERHDSFINEADGRDQPVDPEPQAREVRSRATGL